MKRLLLALALMALTASAQAAVSGYRLDRSPHSPTDLASLQAGARLYVNYCMGCHGLQYMRYNRLTDIGLTEAQIRDNLMFTGERVGDTMQISMERRAARQWFGVAPPDLSVVARSRGSDWLYTFLRTFHRDPNTVTGWNNAVFENVAMPHALWQLQGERAYDRAKHQWTELSPGTLSPVEYDMAMRDLVNFLTYVGEPAAQRRQAIGVGVLFFLLVVLFPLTYWLKKEYWKDVK
jgi:ubiquinol-cytochrome c reductase cytochrome c1 subunit